MKFYLAPLFSGILTGFFLQLALGPVFFYVLSITIDSSYSNGFFAILAVTLADYIYIVLSLIGIGKLLQKDRIKTVFGSVRIFVKTIKPSQSSNFPPESC